MDNSTKKQQLKTRIAVAAGRQEADLVIKNCNLVDVYSSTVRKADIAIVDGKIAGVGQYQAKRIYDGTGKFAIPGLIDGHIHIESSHLVPEELARMIVPLGTTTIIADPHEIVNVCGIDGFNYMLRAGDNTKLDIKYMIPSCVPSTDFETAGANIGADKIAVALQDDRVLGVGEMMDFVGVVQAKDSVLDKIVAGDRAGKIIDGHSPKLYGDDLTAYAATGIHTDHECGTVEEMKDRIARGMYVQLRQGTACRELRILLKGLTQANSRRCILCSDDRQVQSVIEKGDINEHLQICVEEGVDPIVAIQMATLNAAECYRLHDRGAIAPGLRADIVLVNDLTEFRADLVLINGEVVAEKGKYLPAVQKNDDPAVRNRMAVKDFSRQKLNLPLKSSKVYGIKVNPGSVVTSKTVLEVQIDQDGHYQHDPAQDICKLAVIERHQNTGNVGVALIQNLGIKQGAIAQTIAHDSHNIVVAGTNDADMERAIHKIIEMGGGIVVVKDEQILATVELPVAGLMNAGTAEEINAQFNYLHQKIKTDLGVEGRSDIIVTLAFMCLPVIPDIKLTDKGLFDVLSYQFVDLEVE